MAAFPCPLPFPFPFPLRYWTSNHSGCIRARSPRHDVCLFSSDLILCPSLLCRSVAQTKGTTSFGKRHTKTHTGCRRCGKVSFHKQKKECACCGYPQAKIRSCKSVVVVLTVCLATVSFTSLSFFPCSRVGPEGEAEENYRHGPDAVYEDVAASREERLPGG